VRTLARYLIDERGHHRLTIDPAADNAAAVRTYEKVGFRAVGLMREY
jgi:aminoglycoside 6'-N-acetyltransferase